MNSVEDRGSAEQHHRPYSAYRDSGVDWAPTIPNHWAVEPLFTLARERSQRNKGNSVQNVLSLSYGRIVRRDVSANLGLLPESFESYQVLDPGNIVLRLTDLQNDKRSLRVGLVKERGIITSAYVGLELGDRIELSYAFYLLHAYDLTKVFYSLGGGVRQTMKFDHLKRLPIFLPQPDEQRAIASFLDRETEKIDALVAKKERLIELLQEKQTALITQAASKGLEANAPMKESGIEGLGEIPAHWETRKLGHWLSKVMDFRGRTPHKLGMEWGGDIPAVSAVNVRDGYLDLTRGVNYGSEALHDRWMTLGRTKRGDILFTTEAPLGNAALVPDDERYILSQRVVLLRPNPELLDASYFLLLLRSSSFREVIQRQATGSTAEGIKRKHLLATQVWLPPLHEQKLITSSVHDASDPYQPLVSKAQDGLRVLVEFRTSLIAAAVTGRIDVRGEAA